MAWQVALIVISVICSRRAFALLLLLLLPFPHQSPGAAARGRLAAALPAAARGRCVAHLQREHAQQMRQFAEVRPPAVELELPAAHALGPQRRPQLAQEPGGALQEAGEEDLSPGVHLSPVLGEQVGEHHPLAGRVLLLVRDDHEEVHRLLHLVVLVQRARRRGAALGAHLPRHGHHVPGAGRGDRGEDQPVVEKDQLRPQARREQRAEDGGGLDGHLHAGGAVAQHGHPRLVRAG
mmetsp:Transcript_5957/g.8258  ORF Transcript_5957/g.8258 Transcript_5957/m.8258 type:complete len:236 (-) Transcript_5957:379-1086(-)